MAVNTVEIQLDRPRQLLYDHNAMADLDMVFLRDFGKSVLQLFAGFEKISETISEIGDDDVAGMMEHLPPEMMSFAGVRIFLWAGLKHENKMLSMEGVGKLMDAATAKGTTSLDLLPIVLTAVMGSGVFGGNKEDAALPVGKPATPPAVVNA